MKTRKEAKKDISEMVEKNGGKLSVNALYDYVISHMTPEEACKKLLKSSLISYEKLKFDNKHEAVHPVLIMAFAAMDMGWVIRTDRDRGDKEVDGMALGTKEYMKRTFKADFKK